MVDTLKIGENGEVPVIEWRGTPNQHRYADCVVAPGMSEQFIAEAIADSRVSLEGVVVRPGGDFDKPTMIGDFPDKVSVGGRDIRGVSTQIEFLDLVQRRTYKIAESIALKFEEDAVDVYDRLETITEGPFGASVELLRVSMSELEALNPNSRQAGKEEWMAGYVDQHFKSYLNGWVEFKLKDFMRSHEVRWDPDVDVVIDGEEVIVSVREEVDGIRHEF